MTPVQENLDEGELTTRSRQPMAYLWPALALLVPTACYLNSNGNGFLYFLTGALLMVLAIAGQGRMNWERSLENRTPFGREAWLPLSYLVLGALLGVFTSRMIADAFFGKIGIILFILAFSLASEGISRSGLFTYLAYRISENANGSTPRLILYLFLLASFLTAVTSNDIVVLALTPIVMSVCAQAKIKNPILILLSTFVAANTFSMLLLIGSPTNIIISEAIGLNAFTYSLLMIAPALLAFLLTFIVISKVLDQTEKRANLTPVESEDVSLREKFGLILQRRAVPSSWTIQKTYDIPRFSTSESITREMKEWVWLFALSVLALSIVSFREASLIWCATPIAVAALVLSSRHRRREDGDETQPLTVTQEIRAAGDMLREVPWGLLFFGITFFVVASAFASTEYFQTEIIHAVGSLISHGGPFSIAAAIVGTATVVSLFNDLPAAALCGETLQQLDFVNPFNRAMATAGILVGLNIGTYLFPTGALAGLLWFRVMRKERDKLGSETDSEFLLNIPARSDLIRFGFLVFIPVTIILSLCLFGIVGAFSFLLSSWTEHSLLLTSPLSACISLIGLLMCILTVRGFSTELKKRDIFLKHFTQLLTFLDRSYEWSMKHRVAYILAISGALLATSAVILYWVERAHSILYTPNEQTYSSPKQFVTWLSTISTSGFDDTFFPNSLAGAMFVGLLPVVGVALIIQLVRTPGGVYREKLRSRIAKGDALSHRTFIIGNYLRDRQLIGLIHDSSDRFIVLLDRSSGHIKMPDKEDDTADRLHIVEGRNLQAEEIVANFSLLATSEILILADPSEDADLENLLLLKALSNSIQAQHPQIQRIPNVLIEWSRPEMEENLSEYLDPLVMERLGSISAAGSVGEWAAAEMVSQSVLTERLCGIGPLTGDPVPEHSAWIDSRSFAERGFRSIPLSGKLAVGSGSLLSSEPKSAREKKVKWIAAASSAAEVNPFLVVGLGLEIGGTEVGLGCSDPGFLKRSASANSLLVLEQRESAPALAAETASLGAIRVHVVGYTQTARAAIAALRKLEASGVTPQIEIIAHDTRTPRPEPQVADRVRFALHDGESEMARALTSAFSPTQGELDLRPGDRLFIFSPDGEVRQAGLYSAKFAGKVLEGLRSNEGSISGADPTNHACTSSEILIAVESADPSTRFMLEHLQVDKILDTGNIRASWLARWTDIYFKVPLERAKDLGIVAPSQNSASDFRDSIAYSNRFQFFSIVPASEPISGVGVTASRKFSEVVISVRENSSQSQQLLGIVSHNPSSGTPSDGHTARVVCDPDYVITDTDRLLLTSIL
ncbi:Na+/H+ antiporter NhaD-like permease [Actinobacteria bacterium IMCC26207]|nr:Na+/H+ antiporter NhaD-like permease [Actinobacteria bacterium IMCC26207]